MAILADKNTRIIIQGITGREATIFTKDMLDYGSRVVVGTTPGKGGWIVHGIPVYDSVKEALKEYPAEATVISVPPAFVKEASLEALQNGLKLLTIITERVPRKDVVEILEVARQTNAKVVGPNSLGILSPEKVKLGMCGGSVDDTRKAFSLGGVGVISRSGGMTTEIAYLLTSKGIGQSTCISIGGDPIVGSSFVDLVSLFDADAETKAVVIFSEPGGTMEEELADYIIEKRISLPLVAFVAGRFVDEIPGIRFGHAGVIVEGNKGTTKKKIERFRVAKIKVAQEFSQIVDLVKESL